ncbi:MAG: A/G-specific adenine glycosylase [Bryobacteraceae bacterium]
MGCRSGWARQFQTALLDWYRRNRRDLPWRRTRDPYAIWISEIMLQQTRVTAAIPYYERFLARFPDLAALARAPEPELLACWAGLGYYQRARNLRKAARLIAGKGVFPASYEDIRKLPGIGDYTAAAVASIAFDLPHAAVDGNVLRVLSRVLDDATDIASPSGRKHFAAAASSMLAHQAPGDFNQAMMELGATICLPKDPQCLLCPVAALCRVRANGGSANDFPVKLAIRKSVRETRRLLWIERGGKVLAWQRPPDARLMPGFWELPEAGQIEASIGAKLGSFRHTITFHRYLFEIFEAHAPASEGSCRWLSEEELDSVPTSTILKKALRLGRLGKPRPISNRPARSRD